MLKVRSRQSGTLAVSRECAAGFAYASLSEMRATATIRCCACRPGQVGRGSEIYVALPRFAGAGRVTAITP